jgi:plastocyanin
MIKATKLILVATLSLCGSFGYTQTHTIKMVTDIKGIPAFEPSYLLIQPGDTVVWKNMDGDISHNVVANSTGIPKGTDLFASPLLDTSGKEWSHLFSKMGTYRYHCHPHVAKGMKGTIVVGRKSNPDELRTETGAGHHHH